MSDLKRLVSKHVYTDQVINAGPCYLHAVYISSDVNQTGDVYFYDNASAASGTLAFAVDPSAQGVFSCILPHPGILCDKGLFIHIANAHSVTVVYSLV